MADKIKVGVIGMGIMGSGMAYNLAKQGLLFGVFNRTKEKSEEFIEKLKKDNIVNVEIFGNPKELAEKVDVVLTCVSNDEAIESLVYSDKGIIFGIGEGKILLDSSTTSSELTRKISKSLKEKGAHLVAGPMTGSKTKANGGALTFMVGGNKDVAFSLKELFGACGERAVYLGKADVAQDFKVLANQYQSDMLVAYAFKALTGLAAGAPMAGMQEVFDNTAALSGTVKFKSSFICGGDFGETPDKVHFELNLMLKDLRLAKNVRGRIGIKDIIAEQTLQIFEEASKAGFGKKDFVSVVDYIQNSLEYNPTKFRITGNSLTDAKLIVGKGSR
jgi:3-hydroxyisobutyrate dehydrogenase